MECPTCRDNLSAYLDQELSENEREMVEYHVSQCSECASELASLSWAQEIQARLLGPLTVDPRMWAEIEAAISPPQPPLQAAVLRNPLANLFPTPRYRLAGAFLGISLMAVSLLLFEQTRQRQDPQLDTLRHQLDAMVERMDRVDAEFHHQQPPGAEEYGFNPFAPQEVSLDFNPFRQVGSEARDALPGVLSKNTTNFKTETTEIKEIR